MPDLSGRKPRLFVVENELASHASLRDIAIQLIDRTKARVVLRNGKPHEAFRNYSGVRDGADS